MAEFTIRKAQPGDAGLVLYFIGFSAYVRLVLEVLGRFLRELAKLFAKIFEKIENLFEYPRGN